MEPWQFWIRRESLSFVRFASEPVDAELRRDGVLPIISVRRKRLVKYDIIPTRKFAIMNSIDLVRRLHQHRQWANSQLLDVAVQLTHEQLLQAFAMGQGTIWKSLTHLYAAEYVWLEALEGNERPLTPGDAKGKLPGNQEGPDPITELADLQSRWSELNERWRGYLDSLDAESLDDVVYKNSSVSGQRLPACRSDILIHVCTHAQYTSAQVINMMRHVGVQPLPDPMLITMARHED